MLSYVDNLMRRNYHDMANIYQQNALRWLVYYGAVPETLPETQGRALGRYYRNALLAAHFRDRAEECRRASHPRK